MKIDPITLSVVRGILETTQREMTLSLEKTSRSSVLNLARDYSTSLFNAAPEMILQGQDIPIHLGSLMPARKASANFFQPCFLGDELEICPMINRIGSSSLSLNLHAFNNDVERFRGHLITVATDLESHKSIKLPHDILEALNAYKSNCD